MEIIVSPSLLSANFLHLDKEIEMINESEADWLHMDIMDGVFVPNISFGFPVLEAVGKACKKPMDVHLMIVHPENYIQQTADTGAEIMNVQYEACVHLHRTIQAIHDAGMKAGVTLNESSIKKVKRLRKLIETEGSNALIEVDGGVQADTAPRLVESGVDILVSGSYVFKADDPKSTIHSLKQLHR